MAGTEFALVDAFITARAFSGNPAGARPGRPVALPLAVRASTREQLAAGLPFDDPSSTPYRLRISATAARCPDLQAVTNGDDTAVRIVYEGDEEPGVIAERPVLAPLGEYARRLCG